MTDNKVFSQTIQPVRPPEKQPPGSPQVAAAAAQAAPRPGFDLLLKIEAEVRRVDSVGELMFLIANETLKLARARQIFVLIEKNGQFRVEAVSSIGTVERNSPRIRWVEAVIRTLRGEGGLLQMREFALPAYCPPGDAENTSFPYPFLAWLPFTLRDGHAFAGMLLTREVPWTEGDILIAKRLAETYAHAWAALAGPRRLKLRWPVKPVAAALLLLIAAAGFFPVPLTVLAPTEVVSVAPRIIAAPLDGVVDSIAVDPNAEVVAGQVVMRMSDTALRNELAVAEQDVKVAQARLMQVTQGAIADPKVRGDLAVMRSELSVASAKRDYARDLLDRTVVTAPASGIVIYTDKRDWIGRPVSTGERVMEVADPAHVQLRIDVPVADAIAVENGANVRAFLDSNPLRPTSAKVGSASYEAQMIEGNILAYRVYAAIEPGQSDLRLGIRGTAQISGDRVPLAYYLFRRPIAAIRQRLGL